MDVLSSVNHCLQSHLSPASHLPVNERGGHSALDDISHAIVAVLCPLNYKGQVKKNTLLHSTISEGKVSRYLLEKKESQTYS